MARATARKATARTGGQRKPREPAAAGVPRAPRWVREGVGLALLGFVGFLCLSLASYAPDHDPGIFHVAEGDGTVRNLGGPVGSYVASVLKETVGVGAYFVCALLVVFAGLVIWGRRVRMAPWKAPLGLVALLCVSTLCALTLPDRPAPEAGGLVGDHIARWMLAALHPVGSFLLLGLLLVLSVIAMGEIALLVQLRTLAIAVVRLGARLAVLLSRGFCTAGATAGRVALRLGAGSRRGLAALGKALAALREIAGTRVRQIAGRVRSWLRRRRGKEQERLQQAYAAAYPSQPAGLAPPDETPRAEEAPPVAAPPAISGAAAPRIVPAPDEAKGAGKERDRLKLARRPQQAALPFPDPLPRGYRPPPLSLLDDPDPDATPVDTELLYRNAQVLEQKLQDFGVRGKVTEIHPGPIITLYEYAPAPGIKVNRIVNLADDLALAMKAMSVRIVAPIPGKAAVGIEVPNPDRQTVYLKDILASKDFRSNRWRLPLALGKDIAGRPVTTDLSRMPHLLIAGATGAGKSVCLHSLILSLLFRFSPEEVKFLIIDPKMLELSAYHGIPHLMHPVITDAQRAQDALDWVVERMEQRYQLLSEKGVRNIDKYNERIDRESVEREQGANTEPEDGLTEEPEEDPEDGALPERGKLPYIVLVIDEMADLMIVSGRQIEESITRLAAMARAAGIHLLLATQRPSVDVLTGIIKANLPTRISFQVSSRTDSRTILDTMGAEKLLGQGDMLFLPPGTSKIRRIHGAYVTEPEIERVVENIRQYGRPKYEKIPFRSKKSAKNGESDDAFEADEKYDLAVQLVTDTRQASISMIQRKLRVGYNRAARMIEHMERQGIVGPQEGVKPREVLANKLE